MQTNNRFSGQIRWSDWTLDFTGRTLVMGILNVTPDSFSDGGKYFDIPSAIKHGSKLADEGADIIDIGGESTRPGSDAVSPDEQIKRIVPVIKELAPQINIPISIDTTNAKVAEAGLNAGASIINDISALRFDPNVSKLVAERKVPIILMHMKGIPRDMQTNPYYEDTISEIKSFLKDRIEFAVDSGIDQQKIIIDVGIGFGKRLIDNYLLIDRIEEFFEFNLPVLVGHSRKSFIGNTLNISVDKRDEVTLALSGVLAYKGVHILRVHNVEPTVKSCEMIYKLKVECSAK